MTFELFALNYLTWIITVANIYYVWAVGELKLHGWLIAILTQLLWLVYIYATKSWGLIPISFVLGWLGLKNYVVWKKCPPKTLR